MINSVIFSFDRSCQLQLLIDSIERNAKDVFNINVLYKYSNEDFKKGYEILKERFPKVNWVEEEKGKFKEQTLKLMETDLEFSCFFVDDDILFNIFEGDEVCNVLRENNEILCFSPRQGLNTNKCYTLKSDNIILPDKEDNKFIYWDWSKRYADCGYAFFLDGGVYTTREIKKLVKAVGFNNPNTLEGGLNVLFAEDYPKKIMFAYKQSILVGVPINIVNTTHPNRQGEQFGMSTKDLNNRFLNGEIIDYDKIDFSAVVNAAHCEINFEFKKYENEI